ILLLTLVIYPLAKLVVDSVALPRGVKNYVDFFQSNANRRALANTFQLAAIVTLLAVGLGSVVAWWLRSTQSRGVKLALWVTVMTPFCLSIILKNYAFIFLVGRHGVVNDVLLASGLIDRLMSMLFSPSAVVVGVLYTMLPYAILPIYGAFLSIDLDLISAAEGL